ncbi:MAG: hypothetical protein JWQ36_2326, partial [Enterovirga sp.]|nr:hypothetical protein [Enterovirga sp.]
VRALDPERVAGLVLGMVWSAAATGGDAAEAAGTDIAALIVNGLAPRGRRPRPHWVEPAHPDPDLRAGANRRLSGASA